MTSGDPTHARGLKVRRKVLGDEHVDVALARMADFQYPLTPMSAATGMSFPSRIRVATPASRPCRQPVEDGSPVTESRCSIRGADAAP